MAARSSMPLGAIAIEAAAARNRETQFSLRMVKGVPPDGVYSIQGTARVGRSEESEIVLVDPSVSRLHAIVEIDAGEPSVRDLDSTNGTFLNGRRVKFEMLRDGDDLLFGNTHMRFEAV
jgi:pSer/pThr/pTyr-binding forkhead associated (FHA) protein